MDIAWLFSKKTKKGLERLVDSWYHGLLFQSNASNTDIKKTATHVANVFKKYQHTLYVTPVSLLIDIELKFVGKLLARMCALLGVKRFTTRAYYLQTNV